MYQFTYITFFDSHLPRTHTAHIPLFLSRAGAACSATSFDLLLVPAQVAFVHPDLGIGGAERLVREQLGFDCAQQGKITTVRKKSSPDMCCTKQVVDAAVGLVEHGHHVVMYTSHHDASHAFAETHDGTLTVKVHGDFLPRSFFGRGHIMCATLRGIYLSVMMLLVEKQWDVIIVDQLSVSLAPTPPLFCTAISTLFPSPPAYPIPVVPLLPLDSNKNTTP